jgi:ferrous iron transport protein B
MGVSLIIALNMMDMAAERKLEIDVKGLAERLGCPVIPLTAARNKGIEELKGSSGRPPGTHQATAEIVYPAPVQEARELLAGAAGYLRGQKYRFPLAGAETAGRRSTRPSYVPCGQSTLDESAILQKQIEHEEDEEADIVIASARYGFVSWLTRDLVKKQGQADHPVRPDRPRRAQPGASASPFFCWPCI